MEKPKPISEETYEDLKKAYDEGFCWYIEDEYINGFAVKDKTYEMPTIREIQEGEVRVIENDRESIFQTRVPVKIITLLEAYENEHKMEQEKMINQAMAINNFLNSFQNHADGIDIYEFMEILETFDIIKVIVSSYLIGDEYLKVELTKNNQAYFVEEVCKNLGFTETEKTVTNRINSVLVKFRPNDSKPPKVYNEVLEQAKSFVSRSIDRFNDIKNDIEQFDCEDIGTDNWEQLDEVYHSIEESINTLWDVNDNLRRQLDKE